MMGIRKYIGVLFVMILSLQGFGQSYSNNWIDYSQKYYRIPITQEGLYRITYANLSTYGISTGDFDPRNLQIIHNGKVLPLYVTGENDGIFHITDYFEFYAPGGNTGWLDTAMYKNHKPINPEFSLFNDTASYFLTFANTLESPRYDTVRSKNFTAYSPLTYCLKSTRQNLTSTFAENQETSPYYMNGEGWVDASFNMGTSKSFLLSTTNYINVGKPYTLKVGFAGVTSSRHDLFVETTNFSDYTEYYGIDGVHKSFEINEQLTNSSTIVFRSIGGNGKTSDKNAVAYVGIDYTHSFNFEGRDNYNFTIPYVGNADSLLLEIVNFDGGTTPILYCPDIQKRILVTKNGSKYQVIIPNPKKEMKCFIVNQSAIKQVPKIVSVKTKNNTTSKFFDLTSEINEGDYIIITNSALWTGATSYKSYRNSVGYKVVLLDINELYNQFAYGIQKHPYAIHSFLDYALKNWGVKPEHVFLIGKGYHIDKIRKDAVLYANTLIPSMGSPAADMLFATDMHGKRISLDIAIGRLAAKTNTDVQVYLNKVIDHEKQLPAPWMKTVLLFGGGSNTSEKNTIKKILDNYSLMLENDSFGADIHMFLKESSDVFEKTEPEAIREFMNNGTSLLTFFGHSSGTSFDQNIDHPSLFNNKGKYPFMIANSCFPGDIFTEGLNGISETWTLIPEKGSIGFLGSVSLGSVPILDQFTSKLILSVAKNNYGKSIGSSIQMAMLQLNNSSQIMGSSTYPNGILSFTLHGDPAVKIHTFELPDLEVKESSVLFEPAIISTDLTSFTTKVVINNNGRVTLDTCNLHIVFKSEKGSEFIVDTTLIGFYFKDTISIIQDITGFESGKYTVTVHIDSQDTIIEYNESNNITTVNLFISSRDVLPIQPQEYAIIPQNNVELFVSAVDALRPPRAIIIEIDTVPSFTSSLKLSQTILVNNKAITSWKPSLTLIPNKAYFWRVSDADSIKWNESSFTYEESKTGWAQIHPHQFIQSKLTNITFDENAQKYSFVSNPHEIYCQTKGTPTTIDDYFKNYFNYDASLLEMSAPLVDILQVFVFDSITGAPWPSNYNNYGHLNYGVYNGRVHSNFSFHMSYSSSRLACATMLIDSIPDGNHIVIVSFKNSRVDSWEEELLSAFDSLGAKLPRTLNDYTPYIFYVQKGNKESAQEIAGETTTSTISFTKQIVSNYFKGAISSTVIGPSNRFQKLVWQSDKEIVDTSAIAINGVVYPNQHLPLEINIKSNRDRLDTLINTSNYSYISLTNSLEDLPQRTPAYLNAWKVYYDPIGELAIAPEYNFYVNSDTLEMGEIYELHISAQNIAQTQMDSVLVLYEIRNDKNETIAIEYDRTSVVKAMEYAQSILKFNTAITSGWHTVSIEFNPINPQTGMYDQLETHHFNNTMITRFYVTKDKTKPVLDVVVDGRHVIQNDYISAKPTFVITLFDENKFLFLQDTSIFTITIKNKTTGVSTPYYFADSSLKFIAALDSNFTCKVIFTPEFLENGEYELHVQARDMSGNISGIQDYVVPFQINMEPQISVLYNFPNPCSSYTTFRYILTGSEVPANMRIQIFNQLGDLIDEISNAEMGTIHVGTNSVDIYWDGSNAPGNNLANGVYIYRLVFDNQKSYDRLPTDNDQYMNFKYGKLIIQK